MDCSSETCVLRVEKDESHDFMDYLASVYLDMTPEPAVEIDVVTESNGILDFNESLSIHGEASREPEESLIDTNQRSCITFPEDSASVIKLFNYRPYTWFYVHPLGLFDSGQAINCFLYRGKSYQVCTIVKASDDWQAAYSLHPVHLVTEEGASSKSTSADGDAEPTGDCLDNCVTNKEDNPNFSEAHPLTSGFEGIVYNPNGERYGREKSQNNRSLTSMLLDEGETCETIILDDVNEKPLLLPDHNYNYIGRDMEVAAPELNQYTNNNIGHEDSRFKEAHKPGYLKVCQNCGTGSQNFLSCDFCRRSISKDTKIIPQVLQREKSNSVFQLLKKKRQLPDDNRDSTGKKRKLSCQPDVNDNIIQSPSSGLQDKKQPIRNSTNTTTLFNQKEDLKSIQQTALESSKSSGPVFPKNTKWPQVNGIKIDYKDIETLHPDKLLNDNILSFWLDYIQSNILSEADRERTHIFSSFFYERLTRKDTRRKPSTSWEHDPEVTPAERRHQRVAKWTKNIDIFSKDFILVPINEEMHWYVAVICFPGLGAPHWISDDSLIEGWQNVTKRNGKNEYTLPPGMDQVLVEKPEKHDCEIYSSLEKMVIGRKLDPSIACRDEELKNSKEDSLLHEYYLPVTQSCTSSASMNASSGKNETDEIKTEAQPDFSTDRTDFRIKQPCILIFNSLPTFPRSRVLNTLRKYLQEEHKKKRPHEQRSFTKYTMPGFEPNVPQQNNLADCGLYLFEYVENFFQRPLQSFQLPLMNLRHWFTDVAYKREQIYDKIAELFQQYNPNQPGIPTFPREAQTSQLFSASKSSNLDQLNSTTEDTTRENTAVSSGSARAD